MYSRCAIFIATLTQLDVAGKLFHFRLLNHNEFPSLVQCFLNFLRNIYDRTARDNFVLAVDVPVIKLGKPKRVPFLSIVLEVDNITSVPDLTFAAKGSDGRFVGMHRGKHKASIAGVSLDIFRTIVPVYQQ